MKLSICHSEVFKCLLYADIDDIKVERQRELNYVKINRIGGNKMRCKRKGRMVMLGLLAIFLLIFSVWQTPVIAESEENLVGWWKLDGSEREGKPGEVKDASGHGNDLTAEGWEDYPKTVPGVLGKSAQFDGKGQYLYAAPDRESLKVGDESFTLMAWVKSDDLTARCGILGMAVCDYASTCYGFYQREVPKGAPKFFFVVNGDPAIEKPFWNFIAASAQSGWHHLCGVRKWGEKLRLYVDGKLVAEGGKGAINPDKKGEYFLIGAAFHDKDGPTGFFNGLIDDVRLYKGTALSPEQIKAIYMESRKVFDL